MSVFAAAKKQIKWFIGVKRIRIFDGGDWIDVVVKFFSCSDESAYIN